MSKGHFLKTNSHHRVLACEGGRQNTDNFFKNSVYIFVMICKSWDWRCVVQRKWVLPLRTKLGILQNIGLPSFSTGCVQENLCIFKSNATHSSPTYRCNWDLQSSQHNNASEQSPLLCAAIFWTPNAGDRGLACMMYIHLNISTNKYITLNMYSNWYSCILEMFSQIFTDFLVLSL